MGQMECTSLELWTTISNEYKENIKAINKHLNGKKYMVGDSMTICDVYVVLLNVEIC